MDELGIPGVAIGIASPDSEELVCLGVTSLENPLEVTPDTLFQIGSIGKTYVAAAVLQLVERGVLELDAPVRSYLPEFRLADERASAAATIRHLLTHTGGWVGDVFEDFGRGDDALARMVEHLADVPQLTPLGEVWSYNNAGFYVAGRILERVTDESFEQAMRELVLDPLGLRASFYFPDEVITHRFAVGHVRGEHDEPIVAREWSVGRAAHAAGGIVQSLQDMLGYGRFAHSGAPLLQPSSFAEMRRQQVPIGGDYDGVGLAWMLRELGGTPLMLHGGGTNGQISRLIVAPEAGFTFAALTNHGFGDVLIERVGELVLERYLGVREPDPELRRVPDEALAEYAGKYTAWMSDVELSSTEGGLEARFVQTRGFPRPDSPIPPPPPPARLAFYADDWAIATDEIWKGSHAGFLRGGDGRIAWLRLGGRVHARAW